MPKFFKEAMHTSDYHCIFCGKNMLQDFETFQTAHVNHLKPLSKGGAHSAENTVIACSLCNSLKGSYEPEGKETILDIVQDIREEISRRRINRMEDYLTWVLPEKFTSQSKK